jgi:mRNA-degrading endonuclease RelE of RelBE toxin-antitoxin system
LTTSSKNYKVYPTTIFMEQAKKLAKKYPLIKEDFKELQNKLKKDPITGNDFMRKNCLKVRMMITGKSKCQSGGARIIIEVKIINKKVYVLSVYDKADKEDIFDKELKKALKKRLEQFLIYDFFSFQLYKALARLLPKSRSRKRIQFWLNL